jgi:hypothetical protein
MENIIIKEEGFNAKFVDNSSQINLPMDISYISILWNIQSKILFLSFLIHLLFANKDIIPNEQQIIILKQVLLRVMVESMDNSELISIKLVTNIEYERINVVEKLCCDAFKPYNFKQCL